MGEQDWLYRSVAHFHTTVVNTNQASRTPNGQCSCVFFGQAEGYGTGKDNGRSQRSM